MKIYEANGELNREAIDVLYELGNVGVGTAVTAIGNIRQMEIHIDTPNVIAVKKDIFSEIGYDPEQIIVAVTTRMIETVEGSILFLLSKEFVQNTVSKMTGEEFSEEKLLESEDGLSALQELINYMTAGYAKVIGSYLETPVFVSASSVGLDKARKIVQDAIAGSAGRVEKVACVNTRFTIVDEKGRKTDESGRVLIIPDEKSIQKFMEIMED